MELIHLIMDLVVPPVLLIFMLMVLPPYLIYKFLNKILRMFKIEDLTGKVVLITGASSGIGEQLAYEYAKKGVRLALVDIREDKLPQVAETARKFGSPDTINISADVSKSNDCKRFVEETVDYFGRLDHLVNNAGIISVFFFQSSTDISRTLPVMDVNFWGSVYPTQFALPHLKKSKGKILVIASASGWLYGPKISFYGASKAALMNFYDTLRVEFGSSVKITIASPGFTRTAMSQGKHLNMEGSIETNKSKTDALFDMFPLRSASECAKVIVKGVCRGDRQVTDPSWYRIFYLLKVFMPEIMEMFLHIIYIIIPRINRKKNAATTNISTNGIKMS
ncbi:11-beta-hydroxysteroid dehydrogenase 1B [Thalictrum thalictroides]|uniref:11-beta-hydroxysteroid dehydrogenase 1B n=1 Tax=Thalictrum thalictroides TaxID=46969 RepID=A0A7J6WI78_THATH|nr:11-beta-hydroxysteroid dehydrogenase 1B [Thalictrum thalictroides]